MGVEVNWIFNFLIDFLKCNRFIFDIHAMWIIFSWFKFLNIIVLQNYLTFLGNFGNDGKIGMNHSRNELTKIPHFSWKMLDTWTDKYSLPFNINISNRTKHHFKVYNSQIEMCHFTVVLLLKKNKLSLFGKDFSKIPKQWH